MTMFINREKCTGCGQCALQCPAEAISIIDNKAVVDNNLCKECLLCMDECPSGAIEQIREKEEPVYNPSPVPKPPLWSGIEKPHKIGMGMLLLSGLSKLTNGFFQERSLQTRRREHRGKIRKHKRRHGRW